MNIYIITTLMIASTIAVVVNNIYTSEMNIKTMFYKYGYIYFPIISIVLLDIYWGEPKSTIIKLLIIIPLIISGILINIEKRNKLKTL